MGADGRGSRGQQGNGDSATQPSGLDLILISFMLSLGLWSLYSWLLDCKLLVKPLSCFCWHRDVPSFVGVMLRTPGLRCYTILCVVSPLIVFIN